LNCAGAWSWFWSASNWLLSASSSGCSARPTFRDTSCFARTCYNKILVTKLTPMLQMNSELLKKILEVLFPNLINNLFWKSFKQI
jgi:hypothetical protein